MNRLVNAVLVRTLKATEMTVNAFLPERAAMGLRDAAIATRDNVNELKNSDAIFRYGAVVEGTIGGAILGAMGLVADVGQLVALPVRLVALPFSKEVTLDWKWKSWFQS